ncbi:MAG: DUF883 C-terminal domain-containing protein [Candidatus Woesearchaeota archaeon]
MPRRHEPDGIAERYEDIKKRAVDFEEGIEDRIRDKPVQSVLISFGVGLLAGAIIATLMRRK